MRYMYHEILQSSKGLKFCHLQHKWMNLENIVPTESQRKKTVYVITYM